MEELGSGTATGKPFRAAQIGGPLGAYVSENMLDLPMDYETLAGAGAMVGHGGIVVFDETVDMAEMARFAFDFCAIDPVASARRAGLARSAGARRWTRFWPVWTWPKMSR